MLDGVITTYAKYEYVLCLKQLTLNFPINNLFWNHLNNLLYLSVTRLLQWLSETLKQMWNSIKYWSVSSAWTSVVCLLCPLIYCFVTASLMFCLIISNLAHNAVAETLGIHKTEIFLHVLCIHSFVEIDLIIDWYRITKHTEPFFARL